MLSCCNIESDECAIDADQAVSVTSLDPDASKEKPDSLKAGEVRFSPVLEDASKHTHEPLVGTKAIRSSIATVIPSSELLYKEGEDGNAADTFTVAVERTAGARIGIRLGKNSYIIQNIRPDSLIGRYNAGLRDEKRKVKIGDKIVSINGSTGEGIMKQITEDFRDSSVLTFEFLRP